MANVHLVLQLTVASLGWSFMRANSPKLLPSVRVITSLNQSSLRKFSRCIILDMSLSPRLRTFLKSSSLKSPVTKWWWGIFTLHKSLSYGSLSITIHSLWRDLEINLSIASGVIFWCSFRIFFRKTFSLGKYSELSHF